MKKNLAIMLVFTFIINISIFNSFVNGDVEIEESVINEESNESIKLLLTEYFDARNMIFEKNIEKSSLNEVFSEFYVNYDIVKSKEEIRMKGPENLKMYHNVHVISSNNSYIIESIDLVKTTGKKNYKLLVKEWTWVEYNDGKSAKVDEMGYATEHKIIIEEDFTGDMKIQIDEYDDSQILGIRAQDSNIVSSDKKEVISEAFAMTKSSSTNTNVTLDLSKLVRYADRYVKHDYNSSTLQFPDYYNKTVYGYYSSDCANYVSQCLKAGGMQYDYGAGKDNANWDATQWWFDINPSPQYENYDVSPPSWRYVKKFTDYWENKGYSNVSANSSNVYPGNPVVANDSHVTICVGYNSSGTPIINGHNRDVYHVPYTFAGSNLTTIQIATSNNLINKPSNAYSLNMTTTTQSTYKYLQANECEYFKFTVTSGGYYTIGTEYHLSDTVDTYGYLYKETEDSTSGTDLYLYEIARNDDSGSGNNFLISEYLEPGTYYIGVSGYSMSHTGWFKLNYRKGNSL